MSLGQYERYRDDHEVLSAIGAQVATGDKSGDVAISRALADAAVAAWNRDELEELAEPESAQQSALRESAGTLALIGLAIEERGERDSRGRVIIHLHSDLMDAAIEAAR